MDQSVNLDDELRRLLQTAQDQQTLRVAPAPVAPLQLAPAWPWQVPQVPSYTSDHALSAFQQ